jgi:hypothetical protein
MLNHRVCCAQFWHFQSPTSHGSFQSATVDGDATVIEKARQTFAKRCEFLLNEKEQQIISS